MAEIDILSVTFTCENDVPLPVTYFNLRVRRFRRCGDDRDNTLVAMRAGPKAGQVLRYESQLD